MPIDLVTSAEEYSKRVNLDEVMYSGIDGQNSLKFLKIRYDVYINNRGPIRAFLENIGFLREPLRIRNIRESIDMRIMQILSYPPKLDL